jgi:hypothetical protein
MTEASMTEASHNDYDIVSVRAAAAPVYTIQTDEENPKSVERPRKSADLVHGRHIPEAEGLEWSEDFFDDRTEDLVAVFAHVSQPNVCESSPFHKICIRHFF